MGSPTNWYFGKIQREKNISIPSCLFNDEGLKEFDRIIEKKDPNLISVLYKQLSQYMSDEAFDFISEKMKEPRMISSIDRNLITKIVSIKNKDPEYMFKFIGNIIYIANLVDEVNSNKELNKIIKTSLMLWIYVNQIELFNKIVSDLILIHLEETGNIGKGEFKTFIRSFEDNEHPTIGSTINTLERLEYLPKEKEDSIFEKNRILRNRISHASFYYDKDKDIICFNNRYEYKIDEFENDIKQMRHFILEFLYAYNGYSNDITATYKILLSKISNIFLRISRGGLRKAMASVIFDWDY